MCHWQNLEEAEALDGNSFIECLCDKNIFKGSSINFIKLHCALLHDKHIKHNSIWISNQVLIVFDTSPPCTGRSCLSEGRRHERESQPPTERWVASESSFASAMAGARNTVSLEKNGAPCPALCYIKRQFSPFYRLRGLWLQILETNSGLI